jgi:hypothetical protein
MRIHFVNILNKYYNCSNIVFKHVYFKIIIDNNVYGDDCDEVNGPNCRYFSR